MKQPKKPIKLTELKRKFLINKIKKNAINNPKYKKYVEEELAQRKEIQENKKNEERINLSEMSGFFSVKCEYKTIHSYLNYK